jgi:hypothetical protein
MTTFKPISKRDLSRMRLLINELCGMSRNGWANARPEDYLPLEAELRQLLSRKGAAQ